MKTTVLIVGIVIALLGSLGAYRPRVLRVLAGSFRSTAMLYLAAAIRVALGSVVLLAAPECRFTVGLYVLGVITLFSGLLLPVLGKARSVALIGWWRRLPNGAIRACAAVAIAWGAFLALAAL